MKTLKSLFESDVLTDETKQVLQEAWDTAIEANKNDVEVEYAQKLQEAQTKLSQDATTMIEEAIADELSAISDEIVEARTLEIRYATKLNEFKEEYDVKMQEQLKEMVNESVKEEIAELKEEIDQTKKIQFAMSIFESFQDVYHDTFGGENFEAKAQLEEATKELAKYRRDEVMSGLVESLSDDAKAVALTILEGVATENLEKRFESIRPILLKENTEEKIEESADDTTPKGKIVLEGETPKEEQQLEESDSIDPAVARMIARSLAFSKKQK